MPAFNVNGMGGARTTPDSDGRFITFKRRLVSIAQAEIDGVEWALWRMQDDLPKRVAAFREPLHPTPESIGLVITLLRGWLVDQWSPEKAQAEIGKHPRVQTVDEPPASSEQQRATASV